MGYTPHKDRKGSNYRQTSQVAVCTALKMIRSLIILWYPENLILGHILGYIGGTTRHLSTRIKEHLETDKKSHIFAHLVNNETCKALSTENCFEIIDSAATLHLG